MTRNDSTSPLAAPPGRIGKLARLSARHPWKVVAVWVATLIVGRYDPQTGARIPLRDGNGQGTYLRYNG